MAALIERSGRYYAQFYDDRRSPRRKRFSLKTSRKRIAQRLLLRLEDDYVKGTFDPWIDDPWSYDEDEYEAVTVKEAMSRFLQRKKEDGRTENTIRTYREIISLLIDEVGDQRQLEKVSPSEVREFIRRDSLAKATQRKRYGHLRTFFRWCKKEKLLKESPHEDVAAPEKPEKLPKAVTREELELICKTIKEDYEAKKAKGWVQEDEMIWRIPLFKFAFYTGMRRSEIARLRWGHINFKDDLIFIYEQKNGKQQTIPLHDKTREILEELEHGAAEDYVFTSPSFDSTERSERNFGERASEAFREARRAAGLREGLSFHSLRHGTATALAEAGKSATVIKEYMRHADFKTSLRYIHMANKHLKRQLRDVFEE